MKIFRAVFVCLWALVTSPLALACPTCMYEACVLGACVCLPKGGCIVPQPTHEYCSVGGTVDGVTRCSRCTSAVSGDAGKADCLARNLGSHVNFGTCDQSSACTPGTWSTGKKSPLGAKALAPYSGKWVEVAEKSSTPLLARAAVIKTEAVSAGVGNTESVGVDKQIAPGSTGRAILTLTTVSGEEIKCSYTVKRNKAAYEAYSFTSEKCATPGVK